MEDRTPNSEYAHKKNRERFRLLSVMRNSSIAKTAAGNMGLKVIWSAMGLLTGILLARLLGPEEFGKYAIAKSVATLLGTVAALGLPWLLTREVAIYVSKKQWSLFKGILYLGYRWILLASVVLIIGGYVLYLSDLFRFTLTWMGWVMTMMLIPFTAFNLFQAAILRGLNWVVTADFPELFIRPTCVLILIGVVYVFAVPVNGNWALAIQTFGAAVAFLVGLWLLNKRIPKDVKGAAKKFSRSHWLMGSGVFLAITALGMLEGQTPFYILGYFLGSKDAGLFQASAQLVSIVSMGLVAVNMPLQPKLATAWGNRDFETAQQLISEAAKLGAVLAISSGVFLAAFSGFFLKLYGAEFAGGSSILRVLVFGQMINALSGPCGVVLAMTGHQRFALTGIAIALAGNTIFSFSLIPSFGPVGAAIASALGFMLWNGILVLYVWNKTGLLTVAGFR